MGKDIPIIFSGPMVRAQLASRKWMTRRVLYIDRVGRDPGIAMKDADTFAGYPPGPAPKGKHWTLSGWHRREKGDRLWVREAVARIDNSEFGENSYWEYRADTNGESFPGDWPPEEKDNPERPRWRPSIHMPRGASRLTWIVNSARIERLCDISTADAEAEGVFAWRDTWSKKQAAEMFLYGMEAANETHNGSIAQRLFYLFWSSIHGRESWRLNPWVVAISARIIKANIDAPEARAAA